MRRILRTETRDANATSSGYPPKSRREDLPLRIALVIERFTAQGGGVERVAWRVAQELDRAGDDVTIVTRYAGDSDTTDRPGGSTTIRRLRVPSFWQPLRVGAFSLGAARCARREAFDVVHSFSRTRHQDLFRAGGGSHADYLRRTHPPLGRFLREFSPRHRTLLSIEAGVFRDASQRIQCASRLVADTLTREHGVSRDRILLLPNAVDTDHYGSAAAVEAGRRLRLSLDEKAETIWLFPASGWRRKGLAVLFEALTRHRDPNLHLWIAGRDDDRDWRRRAGRLGIGDRVRFLGPRDDLERVYAAVDGMVLPTRYDAFANVTLEAAASRLPIITTRANGAAEWLGDDLCLLEDADDVDALAQAFSRFTDPDHRRDVGARARSRACELDWPTHAARLREEYRRIVSDRATAHGTARSTTHSTAATIQTPGPSSIETQRKAPAPRALRIAWHAGTQDTCRRIELALAKSTPSAATLTKNPRRSVLGLDLPGEDPPAALPSRIILKTHHTATGRHAARERIKRLLGRSPARREWHALERLFAAGVPVPRPLAWGRLDNGDVIVVTECLEGGPITHVATDPNHPRDRALIEALAAAITRLHEAGYRHGDLHLGNCWAMDGRVGLLDLQHAGPLRSTQDRLRDLAQLELSLARAGWSAEARRALRERSSAGPDFDRVLRRFLRDHIRGRSRRVLHVGRNWTATSIRGARGLRDRELSQLALEAILEASRNAEPIDTRRDGRVRIIECRVAGRDYVVKENSADSLRRALADRLRGSPARRAFRRGQANALLSDWSPRPLAYLERHRLGLPRLGWLVLEKVGDEDLDRYEPKSPDEARRIACALGGWLAEAHAWGLRHRDLKAGNLRIEIRGDAIRFWLIDLEDLDEPSDPTHASHVRALAQLNASLDDAAFGVDARIEGLDAYLRRTRFADAPALRREIARRSLAREHRWRGEGCDCRDEPA